MRLRPGIGKLKRLASLHDAAIMPIPQVHLQLCSPYQGRPHYRVEIGHRVRQRAIEK